MKKLLRSLALLVIFVLAVAPVSAQEGQPGEEGARYSVRAGDTLSGIALRFDISVEQLIQANELIDPNQLFVGTIINLPGLDWIDGLIIEEEISFGDDLAGLSRRYRVSQGDLARLNRIVSPNQLLVGYPTLLPTERGEGPANRRVQVASSSSLLEVALLSNANVWALAGVNQLQGTWQAFPGDVLHVPGTEQAGPTALPSPITDVTLATDNLVQGKAVVAEVLSEETIALRGELMGNPLHFFSEEPGVNVALQGIYVLAEPGFYPLSLTIMSGGPEELTYTQTVRVRSGGYDSETLTVDPSFLEPAVSEAESARVAEIVREATPEKLWSGFFQVPSPFGDTINSFFGTRRSYNGSPFDYYHGGVDFGGGLGVQIFAPAAGQVVFAQPLEVRGNATIINHGWGVYTGYWHQSEILVQEGEMVAPGQVIGVVGNTGRSSGAHLHWELWVGGIQVDPLDWLARVYP